MEDKEIIFPERISVIKEAHHSQFKVDGGKTMFAVEIETMDGDNFSSYSMKGGALDQFKNGVKISYKLHKIPNKKTKAKELKMVVEQVARPLLPILDNISIGSLLFIDIETVRVQDKILKDTPLYDSWAYKRRKFDETSPTELKKSYKEKAALYAEFGKIVVVSIGMVKKNGEKVIQSYYGRDEGQVLEEFIKVLSIFVRKIPRLKLCGHSIIGFDIPFIMRRLIVNGIRVPDFLNVVNIKPWDLEDRVMDIANMWKGPGFYGASLTNMTTAFEIPSPKQGIDGSQVSESYYKNKKGLEEITKYCERDVFAVINILELFYNRSISTEFISKTFGDVE